METMIISLLSVVFFCVCCYGLIQSLREKVLLLHFERRYAVSALKMAKFYKVASWSTMTLVFLVSLVYSFIEVYTKL